MWAFCSDKTYVSKTSLKSFAILAKVITRLWKGLSFTKAEQQEVVVSEDEVAIHSVTQRDKCLLALLVNDKDANNEAFILTMAKVWNPEGWVKFHDIGDNRFLVEFQHQSGKEKVMHGHLWSFDSHRISLQNFDESLSPNEVQFHHEPF